MIVHKAFVSSAFREALLCFVTPNFFELFVIIVCFAFNLSLNETERNRY